MAQEKKAVTRKKVEKEPKTFERRLGQLTLMWSDVELALYELLIAYAGVSDHVGRALFSGCRARTACEFILSIAENTDMASERLEDFKFIVQQVRTINTMRDELTHHGSHVFSIYRTSNERMLTNSFRANKDSNVRTRWVSSSMLSDMILDLKDIYEMLNHHRSLAGRNFAPLRDKRQRSAWRYKSPQPEKIRGR